MSMYNIQRQYDESLFVKRQIVREYEKIGIHPDFTLEGNIQFYMDGFVCGICFDDKGVITKLVKRGDL